MKKLSYALLISTSILLWQNTDSIHYKSDYKTINIYVNSIPKCGTHLLTKCVELLTSRPLVELPYDLLTPDKLPTKKGSEFFAHHIGYSEKAVNVFKKYQFKTFLIYRDPRDTAVSSVHWMYKGGWNQQWINDPLRQLPFDELLTHYIKQMRQQYNIFLPWLSENNCCGVKFENLVGPQGGGTLEAQIEEIQKIARHIGKTLNEEEMNHCIANLFGGGPTFNAGQIGSWRKYFKEEHKILFKTVAGQLLIDLGYENNLNWE